MQRRAWIVALASTLAAARASAAWRDVLDEPARKSARAERSILLGAARAGTRLVVVGQRGHVLTSDDGGASWLQAEVPVSSDLVAVQFPTEKRGYAVGHDGVVLASDDGGRRWTRRFDGRQLGPQGLETPLLDVWFSDAERGLAVGAFGLAMRTTDGGQHWESIAERLDNPKGLHLYAVRGVGGEVWIAGEQGLLLRWDREADRFRAVELPYKGTLFGLIGHERVLVVHGLRGTVLRSADRGRTWQAVPTGVAVGLVAATFDAQGRFVIASQAGQLLVSGDDGASFRLAASAAPSAALVAAANDALVVAGPRGVQRIAWR